MRTRRNETVGSTSIVTPALSRGPASSIGGKGSGTPGRAQGDDDQDGPTRSCILTRERAPREALVRLALSPDGEVLPDVRAKAPGRGAWIGVTQAELETAVAKGRLRGALARAFKGAALTIPADLASRVAGALERAALDRLGLEARAGMLLTGSERIEAAARAGKLHALYHAADAGADGAAKLAQAWRVGSDREGQALRGLTLPVGRAILSAALGRDNAVHVGVADHAAAGRLSDALGRWLHFIGPTPNPTPCATAAQGASAAGDGDPRPHEDHE